MTDSKRILIGEIATAHGIKGYVKLRGFVEDESILEHTPLYTKAEGGSVIALTLKNPLKNDWVAEVKGVTDRNAAEALRGTKIYIDRADMPEPDGDDVYIEDLKGLRVLDKDGKQIGILSGVENFGASDLLDIMPETGAGFYVPFTDDTVLDIDLEAGTITVELPETA